MRKVMLWLAFWATTQCGLGPARGADRPSAAGHWQGTIKAGGTALTMVFHVTDAGGKLAATFDSPDQGSTGIPVDSAAVVGDELTLAIRGLRGDFKGKLDAAGAEAVGTWTQAGKATPLTLKKTATPTALVIPAGLVGTWEGKLKVGATDLRIGLKVESRQDGTKVAGFSSPDQGANFLPITAIALDGKAVTAESRAIGAKFAGTLDAAKGEIVGTWTQGGTPFPLTFKKADKVSEPRRTQVPKPPFPYRSEDVAYPNRAAGISLAGTLTVPEGKGPFPAALMITGSGAQDRDETLLGHKPFLVIADALSRRGIAALRVDDRGVGKSTGSQESATSADFAGDVEAGVAYLKSRPEVDPKAIGLIGHSEGGLIAPMVAARSDDVGYIVLLAGTGIDGAEILRMQGQLILKAAGASEAALKAQARLLDDIVAVLRAEADEKAIAVKLEGLAKSAVALIPEAERKTLGDVAETMVKAQLERVNTPWFRYFLAYDPKANLAKVRCPVLAINGGNDLQVPPKENLAAIEAALKAGGNARVTIRELPGLNHLFQKSKTGSPAEYATIEETIDPSVLTLLADWIAATTGRK